MSQHPKAPAGPTHVPRAIDLAAALIHDGAVSFDQTARVYPVSDGEREIHRVIACAQGIFCPCEEHSPLCPHVLAVALRRQHDRAADEMLDRGWLS